MATTTRSSAARSSKTKRSGAGATKSAARRTATSPSRASAKSTAGAAKRSATSTAARKAATRSPAPAKETAGKAVSRPRATIGVGKARGTVLTPAAAERRAAALRELDIYAHADAGGYTGARAGRTSRGKDENRARPRRTKGSGGPHKKGLRHYY